MLKTLPRQSLHIKLFSSSGLKFYISSFTISSFCERIIERFREEKNRKLRQKFSSSEFFYQTALGGRTVFVVHKAGQQGSV